MAISNEQLLAGVKRNPVVTFCVVISLLILLSMYFRAGLKEEATQELEDKSLSGQRMANNLKYASGLDEHLTEISAHQTEIESRLVDEGQLAENLQYFYELEAATETKLVDLRQISDNSRVPSRGQAAPQKSAYKPVRYAVVVTGEYNRLMLFLQKLEGGKHFCRILTAGFVPSVGVGVGGEGGGQAKRSETMTISLSLELLGQP